MTDVVYEDNKPKKTVQFKDVEENQFFYSNCGDLFQKAGVRRANLIATTSGKPEACGFVDFYGDEYIKAICKKVKTIKLEVEE